MLSPLTLCAAAVILTVVGLFAVLSVPAVMIAAGRPATAHLAAAPAVPATPGEPGGSRGGER